MTKVETTIQSLRDKVGQEIGVSNWLLVDQTRINQFADATNDRQWIHVDTERAKLESPLKSTIAHGYLTLSLLAGFALETIDFSGVKQVINYGLDRVRFVSPVVSGSRLRARFTLKSFETIANGVVQVTWLATVEIEGGAKPACVAEMIFRYYPA